MGAGAGASLCAWVLLRLGSRKRDGAVREKTGLVAQLGLAAAAADAFAFVLIAIRQTRASLVAGEGSLAAFAAELGSPARCGPVLDAIAARSEDTAKALEALVTQGDPCDFNVEGVRVEGVARGATAWLRLSHADVHAGSSVGAPSRLAAFIDAYPDPAWLAAKTGAPSYVNRAWLRAVGARDLPQATADSVTLDAGADSLARAVAAGRMPAERVRWTQVAGARRALLVKAAPLESGEVAMWTMDVTQGEAAADTLRRHIAAHELTLDQISDAVAVFGRDRKLAFHNEAFGKLWGLEPAWLAEQPSHGEWLDRLRVLGRLPEHADYTRFKAGELARHERLEPDEPAIWRLPNERTLRVLGQPYPVGGVMLVFSDITPELRLKSQFNHLIQVQRATLDKLGDAVAVFGGDARLKLHNEAFQTLWAVSPDRMARAVDFDAVVELCERRLSDLAFWRGLKGRITSPDPVHRAPATGEVATTDGRRLAWQSRPLPDGATLIGFSDVTDARALESAVSDRESALRQSERLKRDFVANVSHQLRTPLTTILGYSERLARAETAAGGGRGQAAAVREASIQLARLIDKILDIAQLDAGDLKLSRTLVDIGGLLRGARDRWSGPVEAAALTLKVAGGAPGSLTADATRLSQTLDYLMENAIRHTAAGGEVTLSASRGEGEVRLQVGDTGRGIPFHVQAHIFDRFSGEGGAGPGLGLALVKALVELHGGWVALESEPGAGATFTCHLPEATV